jgi:hypothetical protein
MRPPEDAGNAVTATVEQIRRSNIDHRDYFIRLVHQSVNIEGVESVFQRITERDDEMVVDHLMEIRAWCPVQRPWI